MVVWCRIKQSQLRTLSNQLRKFRYFQIHDHCYVNQHNALHTVAGRNNLKVGFQNTQFSLGNSVRFFAAPVQQAKPKNDEKDKNRPRMNEEISAQFVRLVTDEGHNVVTRHEALQRARTLKLDLVEVQSDGKPPVCKLMDYNKEMYQRQVKEKEHMKSKSLSLRKGGPKEVRITNKIDKNDLQVKADTIKRLMDRGYRVKCMAMGTENQDLAGLLSRLSVLIDDVSVVESGPHVEAKQAYIVVRHVKYGPLKKGKKAATSPTSKTTSTQSPTDEDAEESAAEHEADSDEDVEKSNWSVSNENDDDVDQVFDFKDNVNQGHSPMKYAAQASDFASNTTPRVENRYKSAQENRYASARQPNISGPDARNPIRFEPQFRNPPRDHQYNLNRQAPGATSSATPGYDIDPQRQSAPAEVNRYRKGPSSPPSSLNYQGNRMPYGDRGAQPYSNYQGNRMPYSDRSSQPPPSYQGNRMPYGDMDAQGRGGGFGRENSDKNANSDRGNQSNFQR